MCYAILTIVVIAWIRSFSLTVGTI